MKIAFIGLGNMGLPMAQNLAKAGHDIVGFDVATAIQEVAKGVGITLARSNADAAKGADAIVTMLPNGTIAKAVASEVISVMHENALLIDCSTIDVESAREIHIMAAKVNALSLDAPVSGGIGGAAGGTLTFMVGGSDASFAKGKELFDIMGQKAVHCGDGGAGQAAKICNNMLLAISMVGTCEAFAMAEKLGLDANKLFDVISTSSGSCWSVNTYCPLPGVGPQSPADNGYKPGFATDLMVKDSGLAMQAARSVGAATPLGKHAAQLFGAMSAAGMGNDDFSGMINYLKNQAGE